MNKKTIIILSAVTILLLAGGGIYWFYYRNGVAPLEEESLLSKFFPFAGQREIGESAGGNGSILQSGAGQERKLIQLTHGAVSGAAAKNSAVRYIEKSTGHVYEILPDGTGKNRFSNTTILRIFDVFWSYDAEKFLARYFEDLSGGESGYYSVKTLSARVSTTSVEGVFLPQSAFAMAVSPVDEQIFYLTSSAGSEYTAGIIADFENKKQNQILTIPFSEFNVSWPSKDTVALATKASAMADGFLYFLNAKTGDFKKILGEISGLTVSVSPYEDVVLYSQSKNKSIETRVFNINEKTSRDFDLTTLPEKCAWSKIDKFVVYCAAPKNFPMADYPDEWYQGIISFSDSFWKINISNGETAILFSDTDIDAIKLFLDGQEDYLFFINKKDGALWSLKLK